MAVIKFRKTGKDREVLDHHDDSIGRLQHSGDQVDAWYHGPDTSEHENRGFDSHDEAMDWLHEKHYGIMAKKHEKLKLKEDTNMSKELLEMVEAEKPYEVKKMIAEMLREKAAGAIDTIKENVANGYFDPDEEEFDDEDEGDVTEEELVEFVTALAEENDMSVEEVLEHLAEENDMSVEEVLGEIVSHLGEKE